LDHQFNKLPVNKILKFNNNSKNSNLNKIVNQFLGILKLKTPIILHFSNKAGYKLLNKIKINRIINKFNKIIP